MKKILKNEQYQFLVCVIVAILLIMLISSFNVVAPKRQTFISNDLVKVNSYIVLWSKYGYKIEVLLAQPIAVKYSTPYYSSETIYKGDILLIMKKD